MYVPPHFAETDRGRLFDFVEQNSFGLLVSNLDGELFASHLPLLVDRTAGSSGALVGHLARANPQWQADPNVLAIFSGPHAYVSPSWYAADDVVPTWNYVAVHVYGTLAIEHDPTVVRRILHEYVARYERGRPQPWMLDDATEYFDRMARAVVAFRIDIRRIEGKWKLNQNHPRERREKVAQALAGLPGENPQAIAALMTADLQKKAAPP